MNDNDEGTVVIHYIEETGVKHYISIPQDELGEFLDALQEFVA